MGWRLIGLAAAAALASVVVPASSDAAAGSVHTAATDNRTGERMKTVAISKRAWGQPRSVLSLPPRKLGRLASGDRIEGAGDVEISVCLKPNPRHPGPGHPCLGKMYGFNPHVKARLVLARNAGAAKGRRTKPIGPVHSFTCSQKQPARNHHCSYQIPWEGIGIGDVGSLPCAPARCHLNLVLSVHHRKAKRGHKVVLGSNDDNERIHQGKAKLTSALYEGGKARPSRTYAKTKRVRGRVPVTPQGPKSKKRYVVRSLRLGGLRPGDQLIVDSRLLTAIGHLPYNIGQRAELVLASSPRAMSGRGGRAGKISETTTRVSAANGIGCTLGSSGFRTPCVQRKLGIVSIGKRTGKPLYLNLIVAPRASGPATMYRKWRRSHRVKIPRQGSWIRARRYKGTSACRDCALSYSWQEFSPGSQPRGKRGRLIRTLGRYGITQGSYKCDRRSRKPKLVCRWRSQGRYGQDSPYECSSRALWRGKRWDVNVCKEALGAQLWHRLQRRGDSPTFAGACKQLKRQRVRCRWYAQGVRPSGVKYFCKGEAIYDAKRQGWRIDRCRNQRENT